MREVYCLLVLLVAAAFLLQIEWLLLAALAILAALAAADVLAPSAPKAAPAGRAPAAPQPPQQVVVYQQPTAPMGWFDSFMGVMMGKSVEEAAKKKAEAEK